MSDTVESFKDGGGSPSCQPSVRIKHLTRNSDGSSRFPKLDECAHFHYDNVELGPISVSLCEDRQDPMKSGVDVSGGGGSGDLWFCIQVTSNGRSWEVRRNLDNFQMLDRQLHRCVYDRKFSLLKEIVPAEHGQNAEDVVRIMLTEYLERFSQLAGSLINCGPVLNWLELDNRGNRLIITDEAAINTPAVAAAYVIKRYAAQATDEISFEVGDIISVIDMPPPDESTWWRGKKGFQVGFFPCECVEIIGDKVPQTIKIPKVSTKPVLRKHGKLIAFFRQFLLSRPSRRKLKQSGILKERVFGCDLGEHLMNTGRDIPMVLKCCTEFIEEYGIVDGIYRLSGVTSNIQKLRLAFDEDRVPNLLDEAILQDIHCVASLLKMYFRELPNPLLTFHLYDKFVNAVQAEEDIRLLKLRDVVQQLPPPHYRSLEYLMRHLSKVASYGSQTGMTPKNVAIVWAPNLLRSRDVEGGGVGALHVVGVQAILTEYLIRYTDIIFSEKMPVFPSPGHGEETPKKTRPKSLAISTPTKLLSLEEARSRALTSNLPTEQQKFIEVGGGVENLPTKYHTVIELPPGRRGLAKGKKSPSGWKSFFSRGWHTSSGRTKSRSAQRNEISMQSPKVLSPLLHSPLTLQDKAITESDVSHTNHKKLRTVKSAESLFSTAVTSLTPQRLDVIDSLSPQDESTVSSQQTSFDYTPLQEAVSSASPRKSPSYQKHFRSTSHDSYFEHVVEYSHICETEMDFSDSVTCKDDNEIVDQNSDIHLQGESMCITIGDEPFKKTRIRPVSIAACEESPTKLKVAQKQKLVTFDSEASSPKVQKLSIKNQQAVSSSVLSDKSEDGADSARASEKSLGSEIYFEVSSDSSGIHKSNTVPQIQKQEVDDVSSENKVVVCTSVASQTAVLSETPQLISVYDRNLEHSTNLPLKSEVSAPVPFNEEVPQVKTAPLGETEQPMKHLPSLVGKTVFAEVHSNINCSKIAADSCRPDSFKNIVGDSSVENGDSETALHSNAQDSKDARLSLSMEATLSDTLSISQLLSFDSKECGLFSPGPEPNGKVSSDIFGSAPQDSSLLTPDSPTMDNVSDMPSSAGSEMSCSPGDGEKGDKSVPVLASVDKIALSFIDSNERTSSVVSSQHDHHSVSKPQDLVSIEANEKEESSSSDTISKTKGAEVKHSFVDDTKNANCHQTDEILARKTSSLQITCTHRGGDVNAENKLPGDAAAGIVVDSHFHSEEPLFCESLFTDGNLILSPPANFVDDHEIKRAEEQGNNNLNKSISSSKIDSSSPSHVVLERSRTEVHEICPKFVSGIAVSGSFGHQISSLSQELLDSPLSSKKRSGSDRLSPISPVEESRRKFESEIGRLIVRDRQMRLEMEQMQAERQKHKVRTESTPLEKNFSSSKAEKKFADIIELRRSPGKVAETFISTVENKRTSEADDLPKSLKDAAGQKRSSELSATAATHIYPRFLRMDNKPSVKELLSKFEAQPSDSSPVTSAKKAFDSPDSCSKQKPALFSNVQVINHEMHSPLTQDSAESWCSTDCTASHFKEHIFQTECVVRFPHPKTSLVQKKGLSKTRSGSSGKLLESQRNPPDLDSGIKSHDPSKKLTSRAVFLSSDNLLNNYVNYNFSKQNNVTSQPEILSDQSPQYISKESSLDSMDIPVKQHRKLDQQSNERQSSCKVKAYNPFLSDIKSTPLTESEENKKGSYDEESNSSPSEKHTYPKDICRDKKKPSVKLKDEFFAKETSKQLSSETFDFMGRSLKGQNKVQRELSFTKKGNSQGCVQKSALRSERRLKRSPVKERPKSVPPPVCRLSLTAPKHPKAVHVMLPRTGTEQVSLDINKNSDHVPMSVTMHCGSNREGKPEETTASQRHSPPRNVRDRAAMFERSLSFSGCTENLSVQPMTQSLTMFGTQTDSFAAQK